MGDWAVLEDCNITRARKVHTCTWCGEHIVSGDPYRSVKGVYCGEFQHNKYHFECSAASIESLKYGVQEFTPHEYYRGLALPRDERLENYPELSENPWYIHNLRRAKHG